MPRYRSSSPKEPSKAPIGSTPKTNALASRSFAVPTPEEGRSPTTKLQESTLPKFSTSEPRGGQSQPIQPKLTIGIPNDQYEQDADPVLQGVQPVQQTLSFAEKGRSPSDSSLQREAMPEEDEALQRTSSHLTEGQSGDSAASLDLESAISRARGSGQPLDGGLQQSMGQAMQADFSGVKIHTDAQADQLNQSIQAKAFTTGQDIFFRQGAYQPGSQSGQELIAHELTHVVQQQGGTVRRSLVSPPISTDVIQRAGSDTVTIEEVTDEDDGTHHWEPPKDIVQPAVPLMLTDAPWSEVEAREGRERKERAQLEDPRYQQKLKEIGPQAPQTVGKLSGSNPLLEEHFQDHSKEHFQSVDPRYQKKLKEIGPQAPQTVGKLSGSNPLLEEHFQDHSKEHFQFVDPRYQKKLKEISPKAPTEIGQIPEKRKQDLKDAFAQDRVNQMERALKKEEEARKLAELQATQLQMETVSKAAKEKYDQLEPADVKEINQDSKNKELKEAFQKETNGTLAFFQAKLLWAQNILKWSTKRISRRSLLKQLRGEIAATKVPGRFRDAFVQQATVDYDKKATPILMADREEVIQLQANYRNTLKELAADHKKVEDLDKKGGKYGQTSIRDLLLGVDAIISKPDFDVTTDRTTLDEAIKVFNDAWNLLSNNDQGRMKDAQSYEAKLASHSTEGQDPRGKTEEDEALKKINDLFIKTQTAVRDRGTRISNAETTDLKNATDMLDSYKDRDKEKEAHDMKVKYEAAPYFLDDRTSKVVHAERHKIKGASGFKSVAQLERDYKDEVNKQYKASKELWCKYLGYKNGTGNARVTAKAGSHGGVDGHHTLFLGNYTDIVNAKTLDASEVGAVDKSVATLMAVLYPSAGTGGAHYSLEFPDPKPHAYRGGPTIPGARYQADSIANNDVWQAARDYMQQQQTAEETRVRNAIQAALTDHMKVIHRTDPDRRK